MEILKVVKLSKTLGIKHVVKNVTLILNKGDRINIHGGPGAGKTIFIKCLLDHVVRDSGTVSIFGLDPLNYRKEVLAKIGYIPQKNAKTRIKVKDIISLTEKIYGKNDKLIKELHLKTIVNRYLKNLGDDEFLKLNIFISVLKKPELVIIDGLDEKLHFNSIEYLREYVEKNNVTLISVSRERTGYFGETRFALMEEGKLYEYPG